MSRRKSIVERRRRPVVVVDHRRGVVALEAKERLDLRADPLGPVLHGVERVERPLPRLLGVADHPGGAADQRERRVAGVLEPAGGDQLDQVAHVQAGRGRVEADVEPDTALGQRGAQGVAIRGVGEQAAPLQVVEEGRVDGHGGPFSASDRCATGSSLPHAAGYFHRTVDWSSDRIRGGGQVCPRPRDRSRWVGRGVAGPRRGPRPARRDQADRPPAGRVDVRRSRAEREARISAQVNHANVVAVFDFVNDGEHTWLVTEYVEGTTLAQLIRDRGGSPRTRRLRCCSRSPRRSPPRTGWRSSTAT